MPPAKVQKHLRAVNRTIRAAGLDEDGLDSAIVELARDFARRMDDAGGDAMLILLRGYQSALKDLQRAAERVAAARALPRIDPNGSASEPESADGEPDAAEGFFS